MKSVVTVLSQQLSMFRHSFPPTYSPAEKGKKKEKETTFASDGKKKHRQLMRTIFFSYAYISLMNVEYSRPISAILLSCNHS